MKKNDCGLIFQMIVSRNRNTGQQKCTFYYKKQYPFKAEENQKIFELVLK